MSDPLARGARSGIIREILKTPVFKDVIRSCSRSMAYGDGRELVRDVMGQDPEAFLSLVLAVPALANILAGAAEELGVQLRNQYPPAMLAGFLESVLADVDTASLARCGTVWGGILGSLLEASPGAAGRLADKALSSGPAVAAQGIDALARMLNALEKARPGALSAALSRTLACMDRPAASAALGVAANAVLDQKWQVLSWAVGLVRARFRKRWGS